MGSYLITSLQVTSPATAPSCNSPANAKYAIGASTPHVADTCSLTLASCQPPAAPCIPGHQQTNPLTTSFRSHHKALHQAAAVPPTSAGRFSHTYHMQVYVQCTSNQPQSALPPSLDIPWCQLQISSYKCLQLDVRYLSTHTQLSRHRQQHE